MFTDDDSRMPLRVFDSDVARIELDRSIITTDSTVQNKALISLVQTDVVESL